MNGRPEELEALLAAAERTQFYAELSARDFEVEISWLVAKLPRHKDGSIAWRRFELGQRLFNCLCEAQNWRCCYCGSRTNEARKYVERATLEHVIAKCRGGRDHPDNFAIACDGCNTIRGVVDGIHRQEKVIGLP